MRQLPKLQPRRNTRALVRALFPNWSRKQQARWVLAKLRVGSGVWATRIGVKHQDTPNYVPDFVRQLPPGPALMIVKDVRDVTTHIKRYAKGFFK